MQQLQSTMNGLTELQLQQMLSIMQGNASSSSANPKVNNINVPSGFSPPKLIINNRATDHIISSPTLLVTVKKTFLYHQLLCQMIIRSLLSLLELYL